MKLNATDVSDGTGIIEIDLVLPMMPIVTSAIFVIVGVVLGYILSELSRRIQERNKVQKVKDLLKKDFKTLNGLSITYIEKMLGFIEQTQDDNFIDDMMTSITDVIDYSVNNIGFYNFAYWSVLSDSGHLIKLNKDEISIVYGAHFKITGAISNIEEWKKKDLKDLKAIVGNTTLASEKKSFKRILKASIYATLRKHWLIYGTIQNMDISWLDKTQLSLENKEKLDSILIERDIELYE